MPSRGRILPLAELRRQSQRSPRIPDDHDRPVVRAHCRAGIRPCPYVACRHHLGVEIKRRSLRLPFAEDADADESDFLARMPETCALDVAERGDHQSIEIANYLGMSRQGSDQVLAGALVKLRTALEQQAGAQAIEAMRALLRGESVDPDE